jgi:hypothetical protein
MGRLRTAISCCGKLFQKTKSRLTAKAGAWGLNPRPSSRQRAVLDRSLRSSIYFAIDRTIIMPECSPCDSTDHGDESSFRLTPSRRGSSYILRASLDGAVRSLGRLVFKYHQLRPIYHKGSHSSPLDSHQQIIASSRRPACCGKGGRP